MKEITNKKDVSKFLGISENEILDFYVYLKGNWQYKDTKGYYHLYRKVNKNWIELTKGIKAIYVNSYGNKYWKYRDENKYDHLFKFLKRGWVELTKNINTTCALPYDNGYWEYLTKDKYWYFFDENNKLIKKYK